jgi:hypothetical protein
MMVFIDVGVCALNVSSNKQNIAQSKHCMMIVVIMCVRVHVFVCVECIDANGACYAKCEVQTP